METETNIRRIRQYYDKKRMLENLPYEYPRPLFQDTRVKQEPSAWQKIINLMYMFKP